MKITQGNSDTTEDKTNARRRWALSEDCVTGMDVPTEPWTAEDVAFWKGTKHYQPWKDVAAFFRGSEDHG